MRYIQKPLRYSNKPTRRRAPLKVRVVSHVPTYPQPSPPLVQESVFIRPALTFTGAAITKQGYGYQKYRLNSRVSRSLIVGRGIRPAFHDRGGLRSKPIVTTDFLPASDLTPPQQQVLLALQSTFISLPEALDPLRRELVRFGMALDDELVEEDDGHKKLGVLHEKT